ncbi:twin-arginine translocase TatA/TatE family subunit [Nocardioides marmoriginsengisoli]|uniref:Sec-independent protein translocase protein TatA n=1 Tax=Nocardioides marmoriginsengisoli TaxID=661483 RepID=A0A3N0CQZ9_9ACTN|nr:Sec-independent protein translocase subunit TatA [Nocardioides marmoriginsengisoli]RNL65759.1 twin-arginine translocase TatA/TatE family subunit [Nocardioides marmoriginsengisoli]
MFRGGIGAPEIILVLAVVVLLFGAKKLPELARGSGRALRIFKAETKGLIDDDDETPAEAKPLEGREADAARAEAERQADKTD